MSWGTMQNGRCVTAAGSSPRTGNVSTLSHILEEHPDPKYFLSETAVQGILRHRQNHQEKGNGFGATIHTLAV